ncbi:MAG: hypothetical protein ACPG8V_01825 [Alphaproteobacteria bacterium]
MKKEIDIWQFVRIMVEAENNKDGKVLLDNFGDVWTEVDAQLLNLAETDMEAYADMMMNQNIQLETNREVSDAVVAMASIVIENMTAELDKLDPEKDEIAQDLAFEIQGLEQMVDEFAN